MLRVSSPRDSRRFDVEVARLIRPLAHKYSTAFRDAAFGEDENIDRLFRELDSNDPWSRGQVFYYPLGSNRLGKAFWRKLDRISGRKSVLPLRDFRHAPGLHD